MPGYASPHPRFSKSINSMNNGNTDGHKTTSNQSRTSYDNPSVAVQQQDTEVEKNLETQTKAASNRSDDAVSYNFSPWYSSCEKYAQRCAQWVVETHDEKHKI
eukprot:854904-Amphidinium_carterae.2